jgi:hypothetical protein
LRRRRKSVNCTMFSAASACSVSCAIVPPLLTYLMAAKRLPHRRF